MNKTDLTTVKNGIVCFTFDDRNFDGWLNAIPIFKKYNAHASFFISGAIDRKALEVMTVLRDNGHTVGIHTLNHADAPEYFSVRGGEEYIKNEVEPQLKICKANGFEISSFAYPNNLRNEDTDELLGKYFDRFRTGRRDAREEQIFVPISNLKDNHVMRGIGIGEYYDTEESEFLERLDKIASSNTCVTFFSHNIEPNAAFINMPTDLLIKSLEKAQALGISVLGFDEL